MPAPQISPLPDPPLRSEDSKQFADKAEVFVAALPGMVEQTNAVVEYIDLSTSGIDGAVEAVNTARSGALADIGVAKTDAQQAIAADKADANASKLAAASSALLAAAAPLDAERRGDVVDRNIFDPTRFIVGSGIRVSDGAVVPGIGSNYGCSDFIRIGSADYIATFNALNGPSATYGLAFYTAANTANFVAGSGAVALAAGANTATPATANFVRFTIPTGLLYQTDVVRGQTAPTTFRAFESTNTFAARAAFLARVNSTLGIPGNLFDKRNITAGEYFNSGGGTSAGVSYSKTNVIDVAAGASYVCNKSSPANVYSIWRDAGGNLAGVPFMYTAGVPFVAPAVAASLILAYQNTLTDPRLGVGVDTKQSLVVVQGTALPAVYCGFGAVDPAGVDEAGRRAARRLKQKKVDLYERAAITADVLLGSAGTKLTGQTAYILMENVPITPGKGLSINHDFVPGNAAYAWNWFERDGNRMGAASATGVVADITAGQFTLNVTNVGTAGPLLKGLPITAPGVPARSYINGYPPSGPGTPGIYTFTNASAAPATGTTAGAAVSGGGYLANVELMPPSGAATGSVSANKTAQYKLVIADEPITGALVGGGNIYSAPGYSGVKDETRARPWSGLGFGVLGDSKTVDAGGNNAFCATLEDWTRSDLRLTGGGSGRKWYQLLDGAGGGIYQRGPSTPLTQADFVSMQLSLLVISMLTNDFGLRNAAAGATTDPALVWPAKDSTVIGAFGDSWTPTTFTAGLTAGATTLSSITVTRGALQAGMPLRGQGIPTVCTLVDAGGGTWALSNPATGTGSYSTTAQGGTLYADIKYNLVDRVLPWMEASAAVSPTVALIGCDQRFDDVLYHGQTGLFPGNPINGRGLKLTDYVEVVRIMANACGCPFYDSHRNLGINFANYTKMFGDGLHDLAACYETRKGPKLGRWLNSL